MNIDKKINELRTDFEKRISELQKEYDKSEFDKGKWYITTNGNIVKLNKKKGDRWYSNLYIGFHHTTEWGENDEYVLEYDIEREATDKEIETALRKEWKRRTKEKGWDNPDEAEIEGHANDDGRWAAELNSGHFKSYYHEGFDRLYTKNGRVYHDGNWAEPKEKKSDKFFNWEVTDKGDKYKIGCKHYTKDFLQEFTDAIGELQSGITATKLLDEFKKIGFEPIDDLPF